MNFFISHTPFLYDWEIFFLLSWVLTVPWMRKWWMLQRADFHIMMSFRRKLSNLQIFPRPEIKKQIKFGNDLPLAKANHFNIYLYKDKTKRNGTLFPRLFWPSDEKLFWNLFEQWKVRTSFETEWFFNLFLEISPI